MNEIDSAAWRAGRQALEKTIALHLHDQNVSHLDLGYRVLFSLGLMQILPSTGADLASEEGILWKSAEEVLLDPIHNIRRGCRYLSGLVQAYNVDAGLAAYNGGKKFTPAPSASPRG